MKIRASTFSKWRNDERGATAVEFAFVLPVAAMLIIGTLSASQLISVINTMHFAVEEAARCSAVNKTLCNSNAATEAYAASRYAAPGTQPTFVSSIATCGRQVTATTEFTLTIAVALLDVPLTATSCFPAVVSAPTPPPPPPPA